MFTPGKMTFKLLAGVQILAIVLLAACTPGTPVNACHATGDPANPYQEVTITSENIQEHLAHPNDFYPVPVGGCPTTQVEVTNGKITICHATGSSKNPYVLITIDVNGLSGHNKHAGDIIPAPAEGCPKP